jgi:hypothetical protein
MPPVATAPEPSRPGTWLLIRSSSWEHRQGSGHTSCRTATHVVRSQRADAPRPALPLPSRGCSRGPAPAARPPEAVEALCRSTRSRRLAAAGSNAFGEFFLYLLCHDFRKINGRIKIFEKCTSDTVPYGGRLLPPCATEPGSGGRAARRGARTLPPSGTTAGPYPRATRR